MGFVLFKPAEIELHLAFVGCLEPTHLQIDRHEPSQPPMVKQQIAVVIVGIDGDAFLACDEREVGPKFQQERFQFP